MAAHVARIEVRKNQLTIHLRPPALDAASHPDRDIEGTALITARIADQTLLIPWRKPPSKKARDILLLALPHDLCTPSGG